MAKVDTIQTSFAGGEFAPALFGRTDIAQYANACAELENFLVKPSGPAISTPGTEYISMCKTGGTTGISRLISFRFSRTDSYIIEMGVDYFRFYTNGAMVVSPGTTAYEVAHTYTAAQLFDVQYSQINDVMYLTHADHPPKKLTRLGASEWTFADFDFIGGPFLPDNTDTAIEINPSAITGSITLAANSSIFTPSAGTVGHIGSFWKIAGPTTDATTGLDIQGYVEITAITNPSTATATVKETLSAATSTTEWAEGSWSSVRGYPARVTFHQRRLVFARTAKQPQNVWPSQSFIYDNFAVNSGNADDALDLQLASTEGNEIKWIVSAKSLIAGTYGGEFVIGSGADGTLTPANASVSKATSWGSEAIVPKKIGNFFYYVQRFGQKLRELFYSWDLDNYKSVDRTILSPHIAGDGFIDLAYQMNPDTVLWCVTSGGTIATLTREVDQEVAAWARQTTDGTYESIATIPSRTEPHDEVWVIVNRTIESATVRYIERFKSQIVPDRQDKCFYVHSGLSYDAFALTTGETIGLSATAGTTVVVSCSTGYFSSDDVDQRIRAIDSDGATVGELHITAYSQTTIVVGEIRSAFGALEYSDTLWGLSVNDISGMGHLEAEEVVVLVDGGTDKPNKTVSSGTITLANDGFIVAIGLPYSQQLKMLPQEAGSQRGTSQGKIQRINEASFKVNRSHKGFKVGGSAAALKTVSYIESTTPEVIYSGTIPNTSFVLERISFRDPSTPMGTPELLYTGTIPNVTVRDNYTVGSQLTLQNDDPLPVELLAIITSIDTNDK